MPSRPVKALLAVEPGVDAEHVQESLPSDEDFNVVAVVSGADEALRWLRDSAADLLFVACAGYSDRALLLLDAVARQNPEMNVMVLGQGSPNGFLRRAFEAGADDIVMLPATPEQVRFEVHKLLARKQGDETPMISEHSKLVCVLGPKGGTGKTLTATNLSVCLAQRGERVALIDLDLQFGDVALCLGLPPERTVYDLAQSPGALDADKLDAFLATHSSGVRTLIAPRRPDQASAVGAELLREVYSILRANYDWVVVDTPPGFTAEVITSIDSATHVVMVGMLDSLSLKNTKLGLETLELDEVRPGEDLPAPEPRSQQGRDQPVGCRGRARPDSGCVHPLRPRDPANRERGNSDRRRAAAVRACRGVRTTDRVARRHRSPGRGACPCRGDVRGILSTPSALRKEGIAMELHERISSGGRPAASQQEPFAELKNKVHMSVISELGPQLFNVAIDPAELRNRVMADVRRHLNDEAGLAREDRDRLTAEILDDILGYGPLERLLADDSITEIMCNGPDDVWIERGGKLYETTVRFTDESHLRRIINKIVSQIGRRIDEASPMVDARLPDGSRVNAIIAPLSLSGPLMTIRKFSKRRLTLEDMINIGSLSEDPPSSCPAASRHSSTCSSRVERDRGRRRS